MDLLGLWPHYVFHEISAFEAMKCVNSNLNEDEWLLIMPITVTLIFQKKSSKLLLVYAWKIDFPPSLEVILEFIFYFFLAEAPDLQN